MSKEDYIYIKFVVAMTVVMSVIQLFTEDFNWWIATVFLWFPVVILLLIMAGTLILEVLKFFLMRLKQPWEKIKNYLSDMIKQ